MRHSFITSRISLIFLLVLVNVWGASPSFINGIYIFNAATKFPVPDTLIQSGDKGFSRESDVNGFVSLENFPSAIAGLTVSKISFDSLFCKTALYGISLNFYCDEKESRPLRSRETARPLCHFAISDF